MNIGSWRIYRWSNAGSLDPGAFRRGWRLSFENRKRPSAAVRNLNCHAAGCGTRRRPMGVVRAGPRARRPGPLRGRLDGAAVEGRGARGGVTSGAPALPKNCPVSWVPRPSPQSAGAGAVTNERFAGLLAPLPYPRDRQRQLSPQALNQREGGENQETITNLSHNLSIRVGQFSVQTLGQPSVQFNRLAIESTGSGVNLTSDI